MTSITIYDGASTIGGNKIYVEDGGAGVFLDFGLNFAKYGRFFQEFLSERSSRGIHDLIHLGLIPEINVYRQDLVPSDMNVSTYKKLDVKAVILSHAHVDHCGNIGLLREDIPVVASETSVAMLKAMRDSSPSGIGSEIAYMSLREPVEGCGGRVLESPVSGYYLSRDFYCSAKPSPELREFLSSRPGESSNRAKKIKPGKLDVLTELSVPFEVKSYPVDHSIYGSNAYILKGDVTIAYTGDFRLHGRLADKTREFLASARDASVLIIEGTRISRKDEIDVTEKEVYENCLKVVEESKKLILVDFAARNFERLDTFMKIAEKTGRQLVVTARGAYLLKAMACAEGSCRMDSDQMRIYFELKNRERVKWETEVVEAEWKERYVTPDEISKDFLSYILCFSFFDLKHLLDINPDGGVYIYSSSEAFSEEQAIDFVRLGEWLKFFKLKMCGIRIVGEGEGARPKFEKGYHTSGHASRNDLKEVIEYVNPDLIVPVHTIGRDWFRDTYKKAVILSEGVKLDL
jgi:ribonuclease J